jgi:dipeptidyl aminopeptidase/acylaminoacyl peptidase
MPTLPKIRTLPFWTVLFAISCISSVIVSGADNATRPPVEAFFAEPDIRSVQLSPDGKYVAFLTTLGTGKVGIALMDVATGKLEPLVAATDENISSFFWKGNDYIVYAGDLGGNESPAFRSFNLPKRKVLELSESYREIYSDRANWARLIDQLKFDPTHILVLGPKAIGSFNIQVWKLDVRTGERRAANSGEDKPDTYDLMADKNGVALARTRLEGDKSIVETRPNPESDFTKVAEFPVNNPQWSLLQFSADGENLYLINTEHSDTGTLQTFNVRTKQLSAPLFNVPGGEIEDILTSWDRTKLYGVAYQTDKYYYKFFDQGRARLQAQIDASLPGTQNIVVSTSQDEKLLVIVATSDRNPGAYYLLDLRVPRIMPIGKFNPRINPALMRPMEPIQFTARDGLTIHGYLTRPAVAEGKRAPLIIHPHGGPFGIRDSWGFNGEVQFLANRGYAVLQINYRGSGGYGYAFQKAGQKEWGGKMQDDLTDGVKWAIDQGIADPARVGIYGASYGGYAALAGVTFTPELYCCGVNYVGVSDLNLITSWARGRFDRGSDIFAREWIGDDSTYKHDRSPVNFVDRIRVPTLHAYGFNDPRVVLENWTRLEAKLKQYNKPYEIIIQGNEGHGFHNEAGRIGFYAKLEEFLDKNMGGIQPSVRLAPMKILEMPAKEKTN